MPNKAIARVPASTTNLGPGFDVLGLALQLYSTISLEEIDKGTEIEVAGVDVDKLSNNKSNIAYRAANLVFDKCAYKPKGLRLVLTNGIPAVRGLGGSGTAILGGLLTIILFLALNCSILPRSLKGIRIMLLHHC